MELSPNEKSVDVRLAKIETLLETLTTRQNELIYDIKNNYVTKTEFRPVMLIAYSWVTLISGFVILGLLNKYFNT